jgi:hypothetical protein
VRSFSDEPSVRGLGLFGPLALEATFGVAAFEPE